MKFKGSIKSRLKKMKEPILEQLEQEQEFQTNLLTTMMTSKDEREIETSERLFQVSVEHCEVLRAALKEYNELSARKWRFNPDTLLTVAANLFGIMLVLNFEKLDIVRSKAFGMILKGRL